MDRLERQQRKLEALQAKEELKFEKKRIKELKKAEKQSGRKRQKEEKQKSEILETIKDVDLKAERDYEPLEVEEFKPKNTAWKKVLAIILWLVVAFLVWQGIVAILNRESTAEMKEKLSKYYTEIKTDSTIRDEAKSFALGFVNDYYRYDSEEDTWATRTSKYLASGVNLSEPALEVDSEDLNNAAVRDVQIEDDYIDVTLSVDVTYVTTEKNDQDEEETKVGRTKHYIKVPMKTNGEDYAVLGGPIYIADANRASVVETNETMDGESVDSDTQVAIEKLAANFLKAYYGTKPSELKYFVTDNYGTPNVVGGNLKLVEITQAKAINVGGRYKAQITATLNNGFGEISEELYMEIIKGEGNRLYVDSITSQ